MQRCPNSVLSRNQPWKPYLNESLCLGSQYYIINLGTGVGGPILCPPRTEANTNSPGVWQEQVTQIDLFTVSGAAWLGSFIVLYQLPTLPPHVIESPPLLPTPSGRISCGFLSFLRMSVLRWYLYLHARAIWLFQNGVLSTIVLSKEAPEICLVPPGSGRHRSLRSGQSRHSLGTTEYCGVTQYWVEVRGKPDRPSWILGMIDLTPTRRPCHLLSSWSVTHKFPFFHRN